MEMETPSAPPDNPQQVSLGMIKQEKVGKQSKSGLHEETQQSSSENVAHQTTELNKSAE